jgi:putative ABC transport system permease protein
MPAMRDWTAYVRERLVLDRLSPERSERIVRELAAQLAEFHADALARGLTDDEADAYVRAQVPDWPGLAEDVTRADRPHQRPRVDRLADRIERSVRRAASASDPARTERGFGVPARERAWEFAGAKPPGFFGGPMLFFSQLLRDARHATRQLARTPLFTIVAVLTIALGVGATSAVFSVVNGVLLRPLPFHDPSALVRVYETTPQFGRFFVAPATFLDWRNQNTVFERLVAYFSSQSETLTGGGEPERVESASVSWDTFHLLGVAPALGTSFIADHDREDGPPVMLISHGLWQRRFGGDPAIVGRSVSASGNPVTILGVMPADFRFPEPTTEIWRPIAIDPSDALRGAHFLRVAGRLKPGVTIERADAEMKAIAERLALQYPENSANESADVVALHESIVGSVKEMLVTLFVAVGVVLLIACANVANLLLVRGSVRQKEIAIRSALGAGRRRLAAQMLSESLVLAGTGGALGLLLAYLAVAPLQSLSAGSIPRVAEIRIDWQVLLFTLTASLLTGLLFGLAPAWHASATRLSGILKDAGRWSSGSAGRWVRSGLLVAEVAMSIVLLVGATLLLRSFDRLANVDPGFRSEDVLAFQASTPRSRYPEEAQRAMFFETLLDKLAVQPGVKAAGMVQTLPLRGSYSLSFQVMGRPLARESDQPSASHRVVSPGYFSAMGVPLKRGRLFTEQDTATSRLVAVVDESFVRRHFPDEDPIGRGLDIGNGVDVPYEIVGIVGDVSYGTLEAVPTPTMYVPHKQDVFSTMWIVVRTDRNLEGLAGSVKQALREVDDQIPAFAITPLATVVAESVAPQRFAMLLVVVFAGVALVLTAVGLYGVVAYSTSQRTREIGVRLAMGATGGDVLRLVVGGGVRLAMIGILIGLASAAALARFVEAMLFEIEPSDPASYAATALLLLAVAAAACYVPARRASRVDPTVALQSE